MKNYKELYFKEKITNIINKDPTINDHLLERFTRTCKDGMILEFGVYSGATINRISSVTKKTVYGFDSFEGLPEDWRNNHGLSKGHFACNIPEVNSNVELIVGLFDQTLEKFLEDHLDPVAFCHIDCDLYSSTKSIFDKLKNRFFSGSILLFDEFTIYPGWEDHEYKAFIEFLIENDFDIKFLGRRHAEAYAFELV